MLNNTHATFPIGDLIGPDVDLGLYLAKYQYLLICYLLHPLGGLLAKFWFAAVINPVLADVEPIRRKMTILTFDMTFI